MKWRLPHTQPHLACPTHAQRPGSPASLLAGVAERMSGNHFLNPRWKPRTEGHGFRACPERSRMDAEMGASLKDKLTRQPNDWRLDIYPRRSYNLW
jgi:hypothetical protein